MAIKNPSPGNEPMDRSAGVYPSPKSNFISKADKHTFFTNHLFVKGGCYRSCTILKFGMQCRDGRLGARSLIFEILFKMLL